MTDALSTPLWAPKDGIHNLRGPFGLSVLVWRLALKRQLVELGVPKDLVTTTRKQVTGSTRPGRRSRFLLATGMWGCNTAEEIAHATGVRLAQVKALAAAPIHRNVPRRGERLSQVILAKLAHSRAGSAVRVGQALRVPTLDAFLLARRMSWFLDVVAIDDDDFWGIPTSDLDELWWQYGLYLRVTRDDLHEATAQLSRPEAIGLGTGTSTRR